MMDEREQKMLIDDLNFLIDRKAERIRSLEAELAAARQELAEAKKNSERLAVANRGLLAVESLINESSGVAGLHLNGDEAPWETLREGGHFEAWLLEFDIALDAARAAEDNADDSG